MGLDVFFVDPKKENKEVPAIERDFAVTGYHLWKGIGFLAFQGKSYNFELETPYSFYSDLSPSEVQEQAEALKNIAHDQSEYGGLADLFAYAAKCGYGTKAGS